MKDSIITKDFGNRSTEPLDLTCQLKYFVK